MGEGRVRWVRTGDLERAGMVCQLEDYLGFSKGVAKAWLTGLLRGKTWRHMSSYDSEGKCQSHVGFESLGIVVSTFSSSEVNAQLLYWVVHRKRAWLRQQREQWGGKFSGLPQTKAGSRWVPEIPSERSRVSGIGTLERAEVWVLSVPLPAGVTQSNASSPSCQWESRVPTLFMQAGSPQELFRASESRFQRGLWKCFINSYKEILFS